MVQGNVSIAGKLFSECLFNDIGRSPVPFFGVVAKPKFHNAVQLTKLHISRHTNPVTKTAETAQHIEGALM
jgi:hypothetical protein